MQLHRLDRVGKYSVAKNVIDYIGKVFNFWKHNEVIYKLKNYDTYILTILSVLVIFTHFSDFLFCFAALEKCSIVLFCII